LSFQFSAGPDPNVFPDARNRLSPLLPAENLNLKTAFLLLPAENLNLKTESCLFAFAC